MAEAIPESVVVAKEVDCPVEAAVAVVPAEPEVAVAVAVDPEMV